MEQPLIDFDLIRSKISIRDENLSNNDQTKQYKKIASLITPYCLSFKDDETRRKYIELFNHLCGTLQYFYQVKIITPRKYLDITSKYITKNHELLISVPDSYEIKHVNLAPRNYLFYQISSRREGIDCSFAQSFMSSDYRLDFRQLFKHLDGVYTFVNLPDNVSLNEICITKHYAIISTALEKQYPNIKEKLSKFLRLKIITFRSPENLTDITKYFRSIDSAPSLNISDSFVSSNNSRLIYAETGVKDIDSKIKLVLDEISKIENTTMIKFLNPQNNRLINYLDFAMLDGTFLFPLYDETAEENQYALSEHFPNNYFLTMMHPDLDLFNKNKVNFANSILLSLI